MMDMKTSRTADEYAFDLALDRHNSYLSRELVEDDGPAEERACAFAEARYGKMPATMSRAKAIEFMRLGWGLKGGKTLAEAFDRSVASNEIKHAGNRSFQVGYDMGPGRSAGGSSIGSRPVSYAVYDTATINAWAGYRVRNAAYL
jgi:hypothetical protein